MMAGVLRCCIWFRAEGAIVATAVVVSVMVFDVAVAVCYLHSVEPCLSKKVRMKPDSSGQGVGVVNAFLLTRMKKLALATYRCLLL